MDGQCAKLELEFWEKVRSCLKIAGKRIIGAVLQLYFVATHKQTPLEIRVAVWGTLAYFILPLDAIPDAIPVVGYADDLGLILKTLSLVEPYLSPEISEMAKRKIDKLFES
jgi:uncharacterized membrane protein YkvA (DUF1232 family)